MHKNTEIFVIGALGGSGTRIVAEILIKLGIFLGKDLNHANDNLIFTRLFKNPNWYKNASRKEIEYRLRIFNNLMTNNHLNIIDFFEVINAFKSNTLIASNWNYYFQFLKMLLSKNSQTNSYWGWKEPNSQIYIEHLASFFPKIKYIQVIRHGLDMAFSDNKQQLYNWGFLYELFPQKAANMNELAQMQLDYWIQSNKRVIYIGKQLLKSRFYVLNYDYLCMNPKDEILKLINFLDINLNPADFEYLAEIPFKSKPKRKYSLNDLSIFSKEQITEVENLGFEI